MKIIKRILFLITIVCLSQTIFLSFASNKLVIDLGSAKMIPMNGSCKLVTNNCGYPILVPLYPSGATKSFFVNPPSCAVVDVCDTTAPTTTDNANDTWRKTDFLVTLASDQPGETKYCVDTNGTCTPDTVGTTVSVTCAANTTCPSQYVRYYSTDILGNIEATKTSAQIKIDKQSPTFTFSNTSGPECTAGSLAITAASDAGAGLHATPYSFNGSTWNTTTTISITAQQPGAQTKTAYVRDSLGNSLSKSATYTFTDIVPKANDFIGHSSVGNTAKTVNWKTLSSATEGTCGNFSIVYDRINTQGTKGNCSVVGDNIIYTPNANQVGSDTCTVQIRDNEGSTTSFTVTWNGIDTAAPTITIANPTTTAATSKTIT
ncbi:MAG: hypothetical protein PHR61_04175, partial [Candidatus Absconditabacteria bacterium]|nr:hypothetical protein [Candidatus Absconditabacteria bacterium]